MYAVEPLYIWSQLHVCSGTPLYLVTTACMQWNPSIPGHNCMYAVEPL